MAFRKTSYAKVFIEDELPSFLVPREEDLVPPPAHGSVSVSPALVSRPVSAPVVKANEPPATDALDRRNRALQLRPIFMVRMVVVAVLLNTLLYVLFNEWPTAIRALAAGL